MSDFLSIRVVLPYHLRTLAQVSDEVTVRVLPPVTIGAVLDALEARYPALCGTIRDHDTLQRRPFIRFFACREDFSPNGPEVLLPESIANGVEALMIVGAMAGG